MGRTSRGQMKPENSEKALGAPAHPDKKASKPWSTGIGGAHELLGWVQRGAGLRRPVGMSNSI